MVRRKSPSNRTHLSRSRSWRRLDDWGRQIGEPTKDIGILVDVITGADSMVAVSNREPAIASEATSHQQRR
jgi:hypothetical protein